MRIAINIRSVSASNLVSMDYYLIELLQRITKQYTAHDFLFLSDKAMDDFFSPSKHINTVVIKPVIKGNLSLKYWYDIKLTAAVKKYKADVLVNLDNACSLLTKLPQVLLVKDLAIIHQPKYFSKSTLWFYKLYQKRFLQTANQIITLSQFVKQDIISNYQIPSEKIAVLPPVANKKFAPILYEERQALKNKYADGKEYFLFVGGTAPPKNLMNVLKAFSIFKKWQQSNMMLLVVGRCDSGFMEKLKTYKYRNEVAMLGYLPQENYSSILAACYALVYISFYEGHCLPLLEAMQTGAASIASSSSPLPEIVADAALYANPIDVEEIANQMKKMYRDENLRSQLINEGLIEAAKFSWDAAAEKFMKIVMAASSK